MYKLVNNVFNVMHSFLYMEAWQYYCNSQCHDIISSEHISYINLNVQYVQTVNNIWNTFAFGDGNI